MELKIPLQQFGLKVHWNPAQYTILYFITGQPPTKSCCEMMVNGKPWDECVVRANYHFARSKKQTNSTSQQEELT